MKKQSIAKVIFSGFLLVALLSFNGCSFLKGLSSAINSLSKLQFKVENVNSFSAAGVNFAGKRSLTDFSISDGLSLANTFKNKNFPSDLVINVSVKNPNDGVTSPTKSAVKLTGLASRLLIDGTPTVNADIMSPVDIPASNQTVIVPVRFSLDMYQFFGNGGYDKLINLALSLAGVGGSSRVSLDAQPTVTSPLGPITYPSRIMIVDKEFR